MLMRWEGKGTQARDDEEGILIDIVSCPNPAYSYIKVIDDEKRIFHSVSGRSVPALPIGTRFSYTSACGYVALRLRPSSIVLPWDDRH
jgi:hypothetical protein